MLTLPLLAAWEFSAATNRMYTLDVFDPESGGGMATMGMESAIESSPEIAALARALRYDAKAIYEYVKNRIAWVPVYGAVNGATGSLVAGRGTDADQACLLHALLQAAEHTTRLRKGAIFYEEEDLQDWYGIADTNWLDDVIVEGGNNLWGWSGQPSWRGILRFWVEIQIGDTWYKLDPAYTEYASEDGVDLASAMGFQLQSLTNAVKQGASCTADYVELGNEQAARSNLTACTVRLLSYIETNAPGATVEELVGGRHQVYEQITAFSTDLPDAVTVGSQAAWSPDSDSIRVTLQHEGINTTFHGYEIADQRVTISYDPSDSYRPQLRVNGELIETGNPTLPGTNYNLIISVNHPFQREYAVNFDRVYTQSVKSASTYLVVHDLGGASKESVARHGRRLGAYLADGLSFTNEAVLGEGMHAAMESGLLQWYAARSQLADMTDVLGYTHHFFGVMKVDSSGSYYIDLSAMVAVAFPRTLSASKLPWFTSFSLVASGLEHSLLEQVQGADRVAASTVKLLGISNADSNKTFFADSNNWDTGYDVKSRLTDYAPDLVTSIENQIDAGAEMILPEKGGITLLEWSGYAYIATGSGGTGMLIGGGYNGAHSAGSDWVFSLPPVDQSLHDAYNALWDAGIPRITASDPVDMQSGAALVDEATLVSGGEGVRGLRLSHHYNSAQAATIRTLGRGWRHSYDIAATETSDGPTAFGDRLARDATPLIVQNFANIQLMQESPGVLEWLTACFVTKWGMDALLNNTVRVGFGNATLEYVRMPDGSFLPPATETTQLIKTNGLFRLVERFGKEYQFNTNGLLSSIVDADGNTMSLAYNAQTNLQTVTDAYSRTLTFGYTGDKLSTVTENAGGLSRSVSFGYTDDDLTSFTDPDGGVWEYAYDTDHQMIALIDPLDQVTASNIYNDVGQVVTQFNGYGEAWAFYCSGYEGTEVDPEGGETTHYFDADGRNLGTEDDLGNRTYNYYDAQGHLISNVNARGFAAVYQYDDNHNLTNRIDAPGNAWRFQYDAAHHLVAAADPLGNTNRYCYSATHHLTNTVDALTNSTALTYYTSGSHKGLPQTVTDRNGNTTTTTYDSFGNPHTIARTDGGTVTNTWNARGDLLVARDANGNPITRTYNERRLLVTVTDALNNTVSNTWNAAGLKTKVTDPLNRETVTTWTPTYQVDTITNPDTGVVRHHYDDRNLLVSITDARGNSVSNIYDSAQRRVATIVDPDGLAITTRFVLDANGNVIATTNALDKTTTFVYDKLDRLVQTTDPLNHSVSNTFDIAGRLVAVADAKGYTTQYEFDAAGRKVAEIKPDGVRESYTLDPNGNMTAFENGLGKTRTFAYDGMNRVTNETDAVSNARGFVFDAAGNLLERHDADGATIEYEYDDLNRLVEIAYPDTGTVRYAYNEVGLRTYQSNAVAEVWYGFDVMDRLVAVTQSVASVQSVVAYSHDLNGNRTNIVYPDSVAVGYTFDAANRLTHVADWGIRTTAYTYDDLHRKTGVDYPSSATGTWTWDDGSRLTRVRHHDGTSNFVDRVYTLDAHGNTTAMELNAGLLPQVSPQIMRLKQNAADELTTIQTKANPGVQAWTDKTPVHDVEGNLTSDGESTFNYDYENRLATVVSGSDSATYYYAGDGSRVAAVTMEPGSTNTRVFVLDYSDPLHRPLAELDENGALIRRFVWGHGLVAQVEADGTVHYFHHDGQGSTLALTDTNNVATDQWFYSPYGEVMVRTGTTDTPYQWVGGRGVRVTPAGLYFMKARYYHAGLKRFLSQDPIGIAGGANLYAYANNSPLVYADPDGKLANVISGGGTDIYYPHGGWNSVNVSGATFEHRTDSGFAVVDDFTQPAQVAFAASGAAVGIGVAGYYAAPYVVAGGTKVVAAVTAAGAAGREAMYRVAASQPLQGLINTTSLQGSHVNARFVTEPSISSVTFGQMAAGLQPYAEAFAAGLSQSAPTPHRSVGSFVADLAGQATYRLATGPTSSGGWETGGTPSAGTATGYEPFSGSFSGSAGRPPK